MKEYPDELTIDEFESFSAGAKEILYFDEYEDQNLGTGSIVIEDNTKRWQAMKIYAERINGQIYTEVDLEDEVGYSKGPRIVNSLGLYVVIKIPGFKVDNS